MKDVELTTLRERWEKGLIVVNAVEHDGTVLVVTKTEYSPTAETKYSLLRYFNTGAKWVVSVGVENTDVEDVLVAFGSALGAKSTI